MRCVLVACLALLAAACDNESSACQPAIAGAAACPAGTFVDAMTNDPICLSPTGLPLCRGSADAVCYVCTGADFADNCLIESGDGSIECVHSCGKC